MTSRFGSDNNQISYAMYNFANTSDEDRWSEKMSHREAGNESSCLSSFGVYDGHMGKRTADECASHLNNMVATNYSNMIKTTIKNKLDESKINTTKENLNTNNSYDNKKDNNNNNDDDIGDDAKEIREKEHESKKFHDIFDYTDLRDIIMCESINKAYNDMDAEVRKHTNSGATINSLYLQFQNNNDSSSKDRKDSNNSDSNDNTGSANRNNIECTPIRVYCANVGDSRCIMLRSYDTKTALSLPSYFTPKTEKDQNSNYNNFNDFSPTKLSQYDINSNSSDDITPLEKTSTISNLKPLLPQCLIEKNSNDDSNRFVAVHLMSEDHKLTLPRERERLENDLIPIWHPLPTDSSPIYSPLFAKTAPPLLLCKSSRSIDDLSSLLLPQETPTLLHSHSRSNSKNNLKNELKNEVKNDVKNEMTFSLKNSSKDNLKDGLKNGLKDCLKKGSNDFLNSSFELSLSTPASPPSPSSSSSSPTSSSSSPSSYVKHRALNPISSIAGETKKTPSSPLSLTPILHVSPASPLLLTISNIPLTVPLPIISSRSSIVSNAPIETSTERPIEIPIETHIKTPIKTHVEKEANRRNSEKTNMFSRNMNKAFDGLKGSNSNSNSSSNETSSLRLNLLKRTILYSKNVNGHIVSRGQSTESLKEKETGNCFLFGCLYFFCFCFFFVCCLILIFLV